MNAELYAAVYRWDQARRALLLAADEESNARLALVSLGFKEPTEGTNNQPLQNGWTLKAVFRTNYTLDAKETEAALKKLPGAISRELVSWKPELKTGRYKALEPAHKAVINEVLTIKPGMPFLELIPPKVPT